MRAEWIGTAWEIVTERPLDQATRDALEERVAAFDRTWSRFRDDSLVAEIARRPGVHAFPPDAAALFDLYRRLYEATDGAVTPLVGASLDALGYDAAYRLRPATPRPAPAWDAAVAWDGERLTTVRPVTLDVGAAGKGYLVDLLAALLTAAGHERFTIDASGDILHAGAPIRVALEDPRNSAQAIGVVTLTGGALCSSASNRRAWANDLHHVIDPATGLPTRAVIATWATAATTLEADGLATALFFADPARLAQTFDFEFARMRADGRVEFSPGLPGEVFIA